MAGSKKTIWDLSLEIAGKDTGASQAIRTVKKQLDDLKAASDQVGKDWKTFTGNAGRLTLGVAGGVTAATAAVISMANSFAETGDRVAKTSAAIGIGIEAYQGLQYAMGQSGVSAEEFDTALQKFSLTVRQGAAGNAAARRQFEEIGLSVDKLANMAPEKAMERLSDYMQTLPNDAERTRVAVTLFGRAAGPKMMAAMKQGSAGLQLLMDEAKSLGAVLTEEQAHQSESYTSAMARLKTSVVGMKNQFIGGAIGPLTTAFDHLKDAIVDQMPAIQELGSKFGTWLGDMVTRLPEIINNIKTFASNVWDNVNKVRDLLGSWQGVARLVGMLVIAPTFISGLKTVWSFGNLIKTGILAIKAAHAASTAAALASVPASTAAGAAAAAGGAAGAAGFGAMAAAVWAATWPVLAVIAAIAAVIAIVVLVVKNFDKIKEVAGIVWDAVCGFVGKAVDFIKNIFGGIGDFFSGVWNGVKNVAGKAWEGIKGGASKAFEGIKGAAGKAGGWLKDNWKTVAIGMVNPYAGGLKYLYEHNEKFKNFCDTTFNKIKDISAAVWDKMPDGVKDVFLKIKGVMDSAVEGIKGIWNGIKDFFTGLWEAIKQGPAAVFDYLKNAFFGLFDAIKEKFFGFINVIKDGWETVKGFFTGIGDKIGSVFTGGRNAVPGHAEGGVFRQPHIAQIAEAGAEAVVPLNRSSQGFDIWKQAGELGGYLKRASEQASAVSAAAPPVQSPETSPVMAAAAQKLSSGETVIKIDFKMTNNFNGGTPGQETLSQISEAGQKAGEDFESKVKTALESIMRENRRVSYA